MKETHHSHREPSKGATAKSQAHPPHPRPHKETKSHSVEAAFRRGMRRSAIFHILLLVSVLAQPLLRDFMTLFESPQEREVRLKAKTSRSAIRVDLVDLPSLKLQDLAQVDPMEEIGAPKLPPPIPVRELKGELPPAKPSATAMLDRTREAGKPEAANKKPDAKSESAEDRLKALRDSMRADAKRRELMQKFGKGKEGGRPALAGNILSDGDSVTGDLATVTDAYNGKVKSQIRRHWNVPGWMSSGKLKARVLVKVAPDGRILSREFLQRSGNAEFDGYVERAIDSSNPLPPPPEALKLTFMEEGLEWGFPN